MSKTFKVCHIPVGEKPRLVEVSYENSLREMQSLVGGLIEFLEVRDDGLAYVVNEEGLINGSLPNRALFANKAMEDAGYIHRWDMETPVKDGDFYYCVMGDFVVTKFDEEGEYVSLTDSEFLTLADEFDFVNSGRSALVALRNDSDLSDVKGFVNYCRMMQQTKESFIDSAVEAHEAGAGNTDRSEQNTREDFRRE